MKQMTLHKNERPLVEVFHADTARAVIESAKATLSRWQRRSTQRRDLVRLSNRQLDDIGITDAQRLEEISKPFWRA